MTHQIEEGRQGAPTVRLSDEQWEKVRPLLDRHDPPRRMGRKRVDPRGVLEAILYRQCTGCPWNSLPKEYPDDSSAHRTYQRWRRLGIIGQLLATLEERPPSC